MSDTREAIMDAAERRIREVGYNAFSFRELAVEIGIKSPSVHHHFPTKGHLAAAVAARYADRFLAAASSPADDVLKAYRVAFRESLVRDGRMCLCGILAAETGSLPEAVANEAKSFFRRCVADIAKRVGGKSAKSVGFGAMATLEGAMLMARALGDITVFDLATAALQVYKKR